MSTTITVSKNPAGSFSHSVAGSGRPVNVVPPADGSTVVVAVAYTLGSPAQTLTIAQITELTNCGDDIEFTIISRPAGQPLPLTGHVIHVGSG